MSRPEPPERCSSPLKRRASSMQPDEGDNVNASEDVEMAMVPLLSEENPSDGEVMDIKLEGQDEASADEASIPQPEMAEATKSPGAQEASGVNGGKVGQAEARLFGLSTPPADSPKRPETQDDQKDGEQQQGVRDDENQQGSELTPSSGSAIDPEGNSETPATTVNGSVDVPMKNGFSSLPEQIKDSASGRSSPAPSPPITRGRLAKSDRVMGATGLNNLGNTCYMNSALQCIRSVEELTKYFLLDDHEKELNFDNILGHGGQVARAYGDLLQNIYRCPPPSSVAPRHFKETIGRFASQFLGFGQQDSQEFLGFLLDGLQEDLNRVKKKPYIERPDSTDDMIGNAEAIQQLAVRCWDISKRRDDSVIADLFTGMYKSTLVCPTCAKVSITFEPFNNLTLPLPIQNVWSRQVKYLPLNDRPVEIHVDLDKNSSMLALKEFIACRVGVPAQRLIGGEEFASKFFKIYEDGQVVSEEISGNDLAVFYELEAAPTNTVPGKMKKKPPKSLLLDNDDDVEPAWNSSLAERMAVPVLHRINPRNGGSCGKIDCVSPPHFILLTPAEARNEDIIRRKVLEKVATFSTWAMLAQPQDSDAAEPADQDVPASAISDVDSSNDSRFTSRTVEGEDDIIDVKIKNAQNDDKIVSHQSPDGVPRPLKKFNKKRPKWMDPSVFLEPHLQNLFELSYFRDGGSLIPTCWSSFSDGKLYPRLSTRKPRQATPQSEDQDMASPGNTAYMTGSTSTPSASEESSTEDAPDSTIASASATRMTVESSEESSDSFPDVKDIPIRPQVAPRVNARVGVRGGDGRKKLKGHRTYSKKGARKFRKQQAAARRNHLGKTIALENDVEDGSAIDDGGPLVRLGEGLVVDWDADAWHVVFQGSCEEADNGQASAPTFMKVEVLSDPQLEAKRQARAQRRKKGISLDDCLDEFEKDEILSEHDMWHCPRCREFRRAAKKFDLWRTPDILVVHLKRFSSSGHRRDKLDITVDFPIEGLDLTHRVLEKEDGKQEVYDLIAVDDHMGGLGGGHYTACAKNFVDNQWYKFDDSFASKYNNYVDRMVSSHAYLLFYRRRSSVPLGGPRFQEVIDRYATRADAVATPEMESR